MSRDDIHKLLGGYATGNLTPDEQQTLFEAALNDQELFDALAREQSLRDLLRDPAAKAQILAALDERPSRWYRGWGWWRPAAAMVAMAGLAAVVVVEVRHARAPVPVMVAQVTLPAEPKSAVANPAPLDTLAAPMKRKVQPAPHRLPAIAENRPAAPTVTATPEAPPATTAAGLRDAGRGGGGGGSEVPTAAPPAAPPPAAPKAEVQATAEKIQSAPVVNARALFYQAQAMAQSFAPRQAQQTEEAAPPPAGRQQQQSASPNQAFAKARLAAAANDLQQRPAPNPGVRYRILRQADTNGPTAAATVTVEFTPNDNGILSVKSAGRTLFSNRVLRLATYTTPALGPSDRELFVVFSRTGPVAVTGAVALGAQPGTILHHSEDADGTYVVGEPASQEIHFTVSLNGQ